LRRPNAAVENARRFARKCGERQKREKHFFLAEMRRDFQNAFYIGDDVFVHQHHAFGFAGCARGVMIVATSFGIAAGQVAS
jgi:hypothetical protein